MPGMPSIGPVGYWNGEFVPEEKMALPVTDRGVAHGVAVTEFVRTFRGRPIFLPAHLERLQKSAQDCRIPLAISAGELTTSLNQLLEHNYALLTESTDLGVIISATPGMNATYAGGRPVQPTLFAHTFPLPAHLWAEASEKGTRLAVSTVPQVPSQCVPVTAKSRSRMAWYLAEQDVRERFPGAQALVLDLDGYIRETSTANVFVVIQGEIVTPPASQVLPGVSRQTTIDLAEAMGLPVQQRPLTIAETLQADEMFVTSTPYCLLPVRELCEPAREWTPPGPLTSRLLQAWWDKTGLNVHEQFRSLTP